MKCSQCIACLILMIWAAACGAQEGAEMPNLAGHWEGRWTDARPEYGGSGGPFSCDATEKTGARKSNVKIWLATFNVGKTRVFEVEFTGVEENGVVVFRGAVDLGKIHGVYKWSGRLTATEFSGEYDAPDEKGVFKMARAEKK